MNKISKAAAALGKKGGQAKSPAKKAASRENGKKGGRPRKDASGETAAMRRTRERVEHWGQRRLEATTTKELDYAREMERKAQMQQSGKHSGRRLPAKPDTPEPTEGRTSIDDVPSRSLNHDEAKVLAQAVDAAPDRTYCAN